MAERAQSFENHKRFLPIWHFFAIPILLINIFVFGWNAIKNPGLWSGWELLVSVAIFLGIGASRQMPLTAQDRLIRLEERTRMSALLPADLRGKERELTRNQYVALRFASDEEMPELVRRTLSGELRTADDIKRAIRNWRADYFRV